MNYQARRPAHTHSEPLFTLNLTGLSPRHIDTITTTLRLLSNPKRLLILACLDPYESTPFAVIQDSTELSPSLLSQYLKQLADNNLVISWHNQQAIPMYLLAQSRFQLFGDPSPDGGATHVYPYTSRPESSASAQ